ncbi:histidine kinase dimerization/phosphoacceptor domain -containing protein [uncultured Methanobrevibacter sp.]|uniref:histidine kinase dimerization/phosphoacceptor domain -containing protein n=1 Tax=uncultured Methanobrevibacter sp. TaxID=253161 RepID=UPI0025D40BDA|nr:histidine kinase dimerization/phosphoacceptor domain -containing protein [uncultured Methanobrevibacter sp.]
MEIVESDERRKILQEYNHRLNNDLQAVMAFIKLQKRFGIDSEEIINFSYVSIASISTIQNQIYNSEDEESKIGVCEFFKEFIKTLEDYYAKSNAIFSYEIENDFDMGPKKMFHLMLLLNEMVNLSLDGAKDDSDNKISFNLEKVGEECILNYSDNSLKIKDRISQSDINKMLFDQLIKQMDGSLESTSEDSFSIKFSYE